MPSTRADTAGPGGAGAGPAARLQALLDTAIERTREGPGLPWEVDDGHRDGYCLAGSDWLLAIRSVDADGLAPYSLVVAESSGEPHWELRSDRGFGRQLSERLASLYVAAAASVAVADAGLLLERVEAELGSTVQRRRPRGRRSRPSPASG